MKPMLLEQLNEKNCVSTRWIATSAGKRVFHVHEDLKRLFSELIENFDYEQDQQGRVSAYWLPLGEALYLMSSYSGERAKIARAHVIHAIDFYLTKAPKLVAENAALKEENRRLSALLEPERRATIPVTIGRRRFINLFGEEEYEPIREIVPVNSLSKIKRLKAARAHAIASQYGIAKRLEKLDNEISFLELMQEGRLLEVTEIEADDGQY